MEWKYVKTLKDNSVFENIEKIYNIEIPTYLKELITKYHVPFITLEFSPSYLKDVGSNPRQLAQLFVDNGYKISIDGFFSKKYLTVDELLKKAGFQIDCFSIHDSI